MPTQRFDAVLFDCDGVLVDSEPITNRVLADMLGELGARLSLEDTIRTFVGKAVWQEFALIRELTGRPVPDGFYDDYKRRRDDALRDTIEAVPGIGVVFDACAATGLPIAVASGAERAKMQITLGRTGLLPRLDPHIYGADQVARSKPHPDVYLLAAKGLRVDPARCLVIEDTATGTQAGVAAGATVFGYCAANDPRALLAAGATMVFDDMHRLAGLLRG